MTLKELAKMLNLSASTVSRVVNGKSYVKPQTREMVLQALKKHDYTPNQIARSLKNKKTKTIAVVIPDISEGFFANVIKGMDNVLTKNGYSIILCDTGENPVKEEHYLNFLLQKQVDGIILATVSKNHKAIYEFMKRRLGVVFFDNLPDIKTGYDFIITDNMNSSIIAVEHLIGLGHGRIGIINGKQDETTGRERFAGYKNALAKNGIPFDKSLVYTGDFKEDSGFTGMKSLIRQNAHMTAVYVTSSKMTFGVIKALRESGKRIPEDIALVGFDIHDPSGLIHPGITTIMQKEEHIGKIAVELLLEQLNENISYIGRKILLEPELVIKDSCGYANK